MSKVYVFEHPLIQHKVAMIRDIHIEFKLKKNQKVIRMVAIKQYKNFLAKPEEKLRLGLVTHTTAKKQHK